jgi:hypothetical protein
MIEIKVDYRNYKKLGTGEMEAEGNLIIVEGDNKQGKTSLIKGILENLNAKSISKEPLTRGTESGFKQIRIPDKDNNPITVNHTFDHKGASKFYATRDDGNHIKNVTEIREIIGTVCPYTVEDVFRLNSSVSGRREIVNNIFLPLLEESAKKRLSDINNEINPTNGKTYIARRDKTKEIELAKASDISNQEKIKNFFLENNTVERWRLLNHIQELAAIHESNKKKLSDITIAKSNSTSNIQILNNWKSTALGVNNFKEQFPRKEYDKVLNDWFDASGNAAEYFDAVITQMNERNFDNEIINLQENVNASEQKLNNAKNISTIINESALKESEIKKLEKEYEDINNKLNDLTKEKKDIFANSQLPEGLEILSDSEYTFNGFELNDAEISESEAWLLILKLMMPIYSGKLLFAGNIGIYGKKALKEVQSLASKYGKICMVEKVNDEREDVAMVAYIEEEEPETNEVPKPEKEVEEKKIDHAKNFQDKVEKVKNGEDVKVEPNHNDVDVNAPIESKDPFTGDENKKETDGKALFGGSSLF